MGDSGWMCCHLGFLTFDAFLVHQQGHPVGSRRWIEEHEPWKVLQTTRANWEAWERLIETEASLVARVRCLDRVGDVAT